MEDDGMNESKDSRESSAWDWRMSGSNSWIWGAVLILVGGLLLLQTFYPDLPVIINAGNWWAIIILVFGVNMIGRGWTIFQHNGRIWGPLLWGVLMVGFSLTQLLTFAASAYVWPVLLILGGLAVLFGGQRG